MKFYKCIKDYICFNDSIPHGRTFIKGELITEKEAQKFGIAFTVTASSLWTQVEISKRDTYWFFGARLEH